MLPHNAEELARGLASEKAIQRFQSINLVTKKFESYKLSESRYQFGR
jgi:hypothetical protein